MTTDELLAVAEVAELLKLNPQTVRDMLDRGDLPAVRVGTRRVRILRSDLEKFTRVAFQPLWNLVGRPAIMLPWDRDSDGLPTAVQFGAPPRQERLLLQLAGELEAPRRWDERRPPV